MKFARHGMPFVTALLCVLKGPAKSVDLNTARAKELQEVPGIGPSTAQAIVRFREKSGPFRRVGD